MPNRSSYSQFVKSEMQKVRAVCGIRCGFAPDSNNVGASDEDNANTELLRQTLIDNRNCAEVADPGSLCSDIMRRGIISYPYLYDSYDSLYDSYNSEEVMLPRARYRERYRYARRYYPYYEYQRYYEWLHRFEDTATNVYRFENQNCLDNLLGRSNIEITDTNINIRNGVKRAQIEQILGKYGRK